MKSLRRVVPLTVCAALLVIGMAPTSTAIQDDIPVVPGENIGRGDPTRVCADIIRAIGLLRASDDIGTDGLANSLTTHATLACAHIEAERVEPASAQVDTAVSTLATNQLISVLAYNTLRPLFVELGFIAAFLDTGKGRRPFKCTIGKTPVVVQNPVPNLGKNGLTNDFSGTYFPGDTTGGNWSIEVMVGPPVDECMLMTLTWSIRIETKVKVDATVTIDTKFLARIFEAAGTAPDGTFDPRARVDGAIECDLRNDPPTGVFRYGGPYTITDGDGGPAGARKNEFKLEWKGLEGPPAGGPPEAVKVHTGSVRVVAAIDFTSTTNIGSMVLTLSGEKPKCTLKRAQ